MSRSSTSPPIRLPSVSIRRSESDASSSRPPRIRTSSAYPRSEVSGVRSSCEASARKRRIRCSDSYRAVYSVSTAPSMVFTASASCPTSVRGSPAGTRFSSPRPSGPSSAATVRAVRVTRLLDAIDLASDQGRRVAVHNRRIHDD